MKVVVNMNGKETEAEYDIPPDATHIGGCRVEDDGSFSLRCLRSDGAEVWQRPKADT